MPSIIIQKIRKISVPFINKMMLFVDSWNLMKSALMVIAIINSIGITSGRIFFLFFQKYILRIIRVRAASIWLLAPNVVQRLLLSSSFTVIKYAGIMDIRVAKYLFSKNLIFVADPNSVIIYLCILVAESSVVAANDTTRTTISVTDIDSDSPIC